MKSTFKLNEHHSISADFDIKISVEIKDPRVPDNVFKADLTLNAYNELVEFFKENDHQFAINMAREKFQ